MIFTMFGYLLLVGAVRRDVRSAIISVVVFVMYGGLLWALLPIRDRTLSWEGHLMGMVIGCVLGAYDGRAGTLAEEHTHTRTVPPPSRSSEVSEKTGLTAREIEEP
jgi:membrane associated rhomboid family serine protease